MTKQELINALEANIKEYETKVNEDPRLQGVIQLYKNQILELQEV